MTAVFDFFEGLLSSLGNLWEWLSTPLPDATPILGGQSPLFALSWGLLAVVVGVVLWRTVVNIL